jgi:hypothetical protein
MTLAIVKNKILEAEVSICTQNFMGTKLSRNTLFKDIILVDVIYTGVALHGRKLLKFTSFHT